MSSLPVETLALAGSSRTSVAAAFWPLTSGREERTLRFVQWLPPSRLRQRPPFRPPSAA